MDPNSLEAHARLVEKAKRGRVDIYFEGDSITRRWAAADYPGLLANWWQNFSEWNAADFGWGGDRVQNILWRLNHGEMDEVHPKVVVLLAGTNNVAAESPIAEDIAKGLRAVIDTIRNKAPEAVIVVTGIFPRNDHGMALLPIINQINTELAMADGKQVRYINVNEKLADSNGNLFPGVMNADGLHPAAQGYQIWADALKPIFREVLGPGGGQAQ